MMTAKNRIPFVMLFSLMIATAAFFMSFAEPVWAAEGDDGSAPDKTKYLLKTFSVDEETDGQQGVHHNKSTFTKNFVLSNKQKEETIAAIEKVVADNIKPGMSDLEKYYTLAIEANKIAEYDWEFWSGGYNFEYYSHQWDSYGVMNERSVCAGIAIFYSQLCHAADLPCLFVITDPDNLDHTINYIPDINGHAYYVDVTENAFLMSDQSNPFEPIYEPNFNCSGDKVDYKSRQIKDCTDYTFDYFNDDGESQVCSELKAYYDVPYSEWFKDFARHQNAKKKYPSAPYKYETPEADSRHVSYYGQRSNFVGEDHKQVWFLDDFYGEPWKEGGLTSADMEAKILNKEFDKQLLTVTGIKKNYDCNNKEELEEAISNEVISAEYFPSCKELSEDEKVVVAETAKLTAGTDFEVTCTGFNETEKTAELTVTGIGAYAGTDKPNTYTIQVKLNSAVVSEPPVAKKNLKYTGKAQELIEKGEAEAGEMQYALGASDAAPDASKFTTAVPTATNAGDYYVWYKAVRNGTIQAESEPVCMEPVVKIAPITVNLEVPERLEVEAGKTVTLSPKLDNAKVRATFTFESWREDIVTVDDNGVVTGVRGGMASISVGAEFDDPNYDIENDGTVIVEVIEPFDISETKVRFVKSSFTYNGKVHKPTIKTVKGRKLKAGTDYTFTIKNSKGKTVSSPKAAGTYTVIVKGKGKYTGTTDGTYTIKKAANPMTLKAKSVKVKYKKLKKKNRYIKQTAAFTVSNAKGTLSYKLVSAKKGKKSFKKKFKVNAKTGKIKVKKKLKKGTYKVKVKVRAAGTANYKASAWKTVTFKVRVK